MASSSDESVSTRSLVALGIAQSICLSTMPMVPTHLHRSRSRPLVFSFSGSRRVSSTRMQSTSRISLLPTSRKLPSGLTRNRMVDLEIDPGTSLVLVRSTQMQRSTIRDPLYGLSLSTFRQCKTSTSRLLKCW